MNEDKVNELTDIFNSRYEKLYAYTFRMVGNHEDTKDILQNSYIKAFSGLDKFKGESSLTTWFYRIVINECYKHFEMLKKLPVKLITEKLEISEQQFFESIDYEQKIDDELIIEELRERCLFAFLKCVPKNQRVCFLLKTCLELSIEEISEVMGMSISNVKVTLFRGRKRLQELFLHRCNLIDPKNPCKCYLWFKYMKDHNYVIPKGYNQIKNDSLRKQHFINMNNLQKIDYLYTVEASITKYEFINQLHDLVSTL
ncbi:MAG TPA: RNA polymerase sigma factor [Bacteroidales bacterium]|nr:RNA polymerase sigma factor [Bacteroidales bacterium]